jgi:DNA-3-methyladenine glycosylase II
MKRYRAPGGSPEAHLVKVCPGMARIVPENPPYAPPEGPVVAPFQSLIRSVAYQQLSGKAATTIFNRVLALTPKKAFPDPKDILKHTDEALRGAGLSRQKIAAMRDIAQKRLDGIIPDLGEIEHLPDEEIITRLSAARGVGRWTVEMYLMFTLGRPDVLPIDDLGVRRGAELALDRTFTPKELAAYGERWSPWRSAAAWHLWRRADKGKPVL